MRWLRTVIRQASQSMSGVTRRLRELVTELEDLTLAVADEHSGYQPRRRTRQTSRSGGVIVQVRGGRAPRAVPVLAR
jgi:hypothetical protein